MVTHTVFLPAPVPHADSDGNAEGAVTLTKFRVMFVVGGLVSWHRAVVCGFFVNFLNVAPRRPADGGSVPYRRYRHRLCGRTGERGPGDE